MEPVNRMAPARKAQRGVTMLEVAIFTAVMAPLMIALATTVTVFSSSATQGHHQTQATAQNERIIQLITAELMQGSTRLDHYVPATMPRPHPTIGPDLSTTNHFYDFVAAGASPFMDTLHETQTRDANEYWHTPVSTRRFYIYGTYAAFDTIEFQKVRTPLDDMSHVNTGAGTVSQPWSAPRKIFLEDGQVLLRVQTPGGARTRVLGTNVESLAFHLNADGHVLIQLVTFSGPAGGAAADPRGARVSSQVTVAPRNSLS